MNSYHKAMLNTMRGDPVYGVLIECSEAFRMNALGTPLECHQSLCVEDFLLTKPAAIRIALEKGWTYDAEGKWLCPLCKKRQEEECHHGHVGECVLCEDEKEEAFIARRLVLCEEEEAINKGEE